MAVEFKDYYKILGIDRKADAKTIKSAYRKLARKHHPDVAKGKDGDRFKEITEANEVLSDPEKRRRYDTLGPDWQRYARPQPGPGAGPGPAGGFHVEYGSEGGSDFSDFFRTIFGDLGGRGGGGGRGGRGAGRGVNLEDLLGGGDRGGARPRGQDVEAHVEISLDEAFTGTRRSFALELEEPCSTCRGAGNVKGKPCSTCSGTGWHRARREVDVKVPAGVRTGQKVRVSGEGGALGGARGDLYLGVTVAPHSLFERKGDDLLVEVPISAAEAALGASVDVPTLKGQVTMKIPPATSSGRTFRLPGYGMPRLKGGAAGDELVKIKIVMPASLTDQERALYEQLKALRADNPRTYQR
jgi:DnaJ-class molecular chaperone